MDEPLLIRLDSRNDAIVNIGSLVEVDCLFYHKTQSPQGKQRGWL